MSKSLKKLWEYTDLHNPKVGQYVIYGLFGFLLILALVLRKSLVGFTNPDYKLFSAWYDFAKLHGIHVFKYTYEQGFTNYNPPYSYFLYLITLLPISKMLAIKGLLAVFDLVLATAVYFVVKVFRQGYTPWFAALATLFLPTVLVTGVFWGQFDQLYIAAMLFSLFCGLRDNSKWAWIWFGIAIAIKFQAIFFLPVLGILIFKRIRWYDAYWAAISFLVLTLPPIFAGRSVGSLLNIYPAQAKLFNGQLTLNAPNMYQWFPNSAFAYLNHAAIGLGIGVAALTLLVSLVYRKFSNRELLLATTFLLYAVPFFLPAMHERYFFPADIASMVLVFAFPSLSFVTIAVVMQIVTLFSYAPFLFGTEILPMSVLALISLWLVVMLGYNFLRSDGEVILGKRLSRTAQKSKA